MWSMSTGMVICVNVFPVVGMCLSMSDKETVSNSDVHLLEYLLS